MKRMTRLEMLKRLERDEVSVADVAKRLNLSVRHVKRLRRAYAERGKAAVIHGNTGRAPWNRVADEKRNAVLTLFEKKYRGFNDQHFTEKLEGEGVEVSRQSVQRWLRAAGLPAARKRRPPKHRSRRERKARVGEMLLWDGSRHAWLEERGPLLSLMGAVDDATGELMPGAHFVEQECAAGYLRVLRAIAREKGLPCSIYMDRHGSLHRNDDHWTLEEELRGGQDPTQVGRALLTLGIEAIYALSPQAKGRVERLWGTLQDRVVSELRLAGCRTLEEANVLLERCRLDYNRRFAVPARESQSAWVRVPRAVDLERICSFYYEATVLNDNTVRFGGRVFDIPAGPGGRGYQKARVEVRQLLDGSWRIYRGDQVIATAEATELAELKARRQRKRGAASRAFRRGLERLRA